MPPFLSIPALFLYNPILQVCATSTMFIRSRVTVSSGFLTADQLKSSYEVCKQFHRIALARRLEHSDARFKLSVIVLFFSPHSVPGYYYHQLMNFLSNTYVNFLPLVQTVKCVLEYMTENCLHRVLLVFSLYFPLLSMFG